MKLSKKGLLLGLGFVFLGVTAFNSVLTDVYICKGPQSKKYHYSARCRGLSNCSTDIYQVPLSDAKKLGRTLCGWED